MNFHSIYAMLQVLETATNAAAQHVDTVQVDALEYVCRHDFVLVGTGMRLGSFAAGSLVNLCGRNEGGKVLSRESVFAVLADLQMLFSGSSHLSAIGRNTGRMLVSLNRCSIMAISDTNKRLMLDFDGLTDMLVEAMMGDVQRPGEQAVQDASAGVLESLALFSPWAEALRFHEAALAALREVHTRGAEVASRSAAGALFQLEDRAGQMTYTVIFDGESVARTLFDRLKKIIKDFQRARVLAAKASRDGSSSPSSQTMINLRSPVVLVRNETTVLPYPFRDSAMGPTAFGYPCAPYVYSPAECAQPVYGCRLPPY